MARNNGSERSYFPHCTKEWFKLSEDIRCIESAEKFEKAIPDFIRPNENSA